MQTFILTVSWTMTAVIEITAPTQNAAIEKAYEGELPQGEYCTDSFEVHTETIEVR